MVCQNWYGGAMRTLPETNGGAFYGAAERVRGVPKWARRCHADAATGALGGDPHGATKIVSGVPKLVRWCHAGAVTGAF
eukprot:5178922-Pyramimonas_sp.AAC.1